MTSYFKSIPAALIMAAICLSCERDNGFTQSRNETGDVPGSKHDKNPENKKDTVVYVTAVEFPEGYHWQRDSSGEAADCKIVLFANSERIAETPAGGAETAGPAADMHRCIDGHLYTDFSTPSETIVKRDGKEIFRYPGREMICGFLCEKDGIYTLGQNRSGNGFALRKNGIEIYSSTTGQVIGTIRNSCCESGALYYDEGEMRFSFKKTATLNGKQYVSYHLVSGHDANTLKVEQLNTDENIAYVYDIRMIRGTTYIAAAISQYNMSPMLYAGDRIIPMGTMNQNQIANCRILWSDKHIYMKMDVSYDKWETCGSYLIREDGLKHDTDSRRNSRAVEYYLDGDNYAYIVTDGFNIAAIASNEASNTQIRHYSPGNEYIAINGDCAVLTGDDLYAGFSPVKKSEHPLISHNGKAKPLEINGYITSVKASVK